ncbi:MAG: erythromycin esterase family protein [Patescibacteria group bacterium]
MPLCVVGFGTYEGKTIAASAWEDAATEMAVPPARWASWDDLLHRAEVGNSFYLLRPPVAPVFLDERDQRAIGVVYDPQSEEGNYAPTTLAKRYDALIFIDKSSALAPLPLSLRREEEFPETYPSGV